MTGQDGGEAVAQQPDREKHEQRANSELRRWPVNLSIYAVRRHTTASSCLASDVIVSKRTVVMLANGVIPPSHRQQ